MHSIMNSKKVLLILLVLAVFQINYSQAAFTRITKQLANDHRRMKLAMGISTEEEEVSLEERLVQLYHDESDTVVDRRMPYGHSMDSDRGENSERNTDVDSNQGSQQMKSKDGMIKQRQIRDTSPMNNHIPKFSEDLYYKLFSCSLRHNAIIITVTAAVADHSIIRYSIESGNEEGLFSIGDLSGDIRLLATPGIGSYSLIVRATVNSNSNLHNTVQVSLSSYFPGGAPIFRKTAYVGNITEKLSANTKIIQVKALSDDKVIYAIERGNDHASFTIDRLRGTILTTRPLIYNSMKAKHKLIISARDISGKISTVVVRINTLRSPYRPMFQPTVYSPLPWRKSYAAHIIENSTLDTVVLHVHATTVAWSASNKNGSPVTYYIASGNADEAFLLDPDTGYLSVVKTLDREKHSHYHFVVRATSKIYPMLYDDAIINITITDINDNTPVFASGCSTTGDSGSTKVKKFSQVHCMRLIDENAAIGSFIMSVTATDADNGNNGKLIYSITDGNVGGTFSIDSDLGHIFLRRKLDRETISAYRLTIQASDKGNPARSSQVYVAVYVSDVNDNPPKVNQSSLVGYIHNSMSRGHVVTRLIATDPDEPYNGPPFTYIITGGNDNHWFRLNSTTGTLRYVRSIPNHGPRMIQLHVQVQDNGKPPLASIWTIVIHVSYDVTQIHLSQRYYNVSMDYNSPIGTTVAKVQLLHEHQVPERNLAYDIVGGNPMATFAINNHGKVQLVQQPLVSITMYKLLIRAYNRYNQTLSGYAYVIVKTNNAGALTGTNNIVLYVIIPISIVLVCVIGFIVYRKWLGNLRARQQDNTDCARDRSWPCNLFSSFTVASNSVTTVANDTTNNARLNNHTANVDVINKQGGCTKDAVNKQIDCVNIATQEDYLTQDEADGKNINVNDTFSVNVRYQNNIYCARDISDHKNRFQLR